MRAFRCPTCAQLLFFENSVCLNCSTEVGIASEPLGMAAVSDELVRCANQRVAECNWLVPAGGEEPLCRSCRTTTVRPGDDDPEGLAQFAEAEAAKRRVLYQLLELGLPVDELTLDFQLRSSTSEPVMTGHASGTITLDLAETDDAQRTQRREELGEPYRTTIGHFRHELGHYYQGILLTTERDWERARELFGDERVDYQEALDRHYAEGARAGWQDEFVSAYATMHPWEDWAETFAHYLHIRATLETATAYGMRIDGPQGGRPGLDLNFDPAETDEGGDFRSVVNDAWLPLTYALNQMNRSMGRRPLYPFVLSEPAIEKLAFMHLRVRAVTREGSLAQLRATDTAHGERPLDASDVAHPEEGPAPGAVPGDPVPDGA